MTFCVLLYNNKINNYPIFNYLSISMFGATIFVFEFLGVNFPFCSVSRSTAQQLDFSLILQFSELKNLIAPLQHPILFCIILILYYK
jgi:hypothetical protein